MALATVLECDVYDAHTKPFFEHRPHEYRPGPFVLHVAFPFQIDDFEGEVKRYVAIYDPDHTVVHSTVQVGTCDRLGVTHSPVRGKHPNLVDGLTAFKKHYGGWGATEVSQLLRPWFPDCQTHDWAATTEAAKLWELTQFGLEVAVQKRIWDYCMRMDLPFEEVYTDFGLSYNEGWLELGHPEYLKQILQHTHGPIGGHCVIPGTQLLKDQSNELIAQVVLAVQRDLEGK